MPRCPHCRLDPEATPRVRDDVAGRCTEGRSSPCLACQKLLEIEVKIAETRRVLEQLLTEREELAFQLNEHHDPFLTQLPVEIVSHIFTLSRPYQPSLDIFDTSFNEQKNIRGVLTPGHVCLNWRNIANRTPELWSVFGTTILTENCASSLEMSLAWLGRSGGLPLFVRLHMRDPANEDASHTTAEFLASIAQHAQRWRVLDLTIPIDLVHLFSAAVSGSHLDRLKHLSLDIDLSHPYNTRPLVLSASPQRLSVDSGWLQHIIIDWTKLTHFAGACSPEFTVSECAYLFQSAPNLSTCTIGTVLADTLQGAVVTNCSLHTLQLGPCYTSFWDHFNFPSLRTVRLDEGSDTESWIAFVNFLHRSECNITDLHIDGGAETPEDDNNDILDCLKLTPSVERLSIAGFKLAGRLLSSINNILGSGDPIQSDPPVLPKINALVFRSYESSVLLNWTTLVSFMTAYTSKATQNLRSVDILFDMQLSFDPEAMIVERTTLKQLLDIAGVELRVVDHEGSDLLGRLRRHYGL